jgi:ferredoxin/flavodoxin
MIFYFSGTGNSEWAAKQIAKRTGDTVVSIAECTRNGQFSFELADGERIGFVFPVYFYGVPTIVSDFIWRLELSGNAGYTFAICTSGGDPARANSMQKKALVRRGMRLDAAFELSMPDNYIILFDLMTPPDKAALLFEAAKESIEGIAAEVLSAKPIPPRSGLGRWIKTAAFYPIYKNGRNTRKFYVLVDCNGCGLCEKLCPCSMIEMQSRRPVWKVDKCTQCLACLHRCPKRAIQYGRKTLSRGRYVNPNVK